MRSIITVGLLLVCSVFASESPDQLRDQGLEALKSAQADETKTVEAARLLAQAAEAYEKAGNDNSAAELNAYLYWCKKRMTLAQTEAFAGTGDSGKRIVEKLEALATQKVETGEVGQWMKRAEDFETAHPNGPLLCAIRYFEVADRFIGTQESLVAQRKSLNLMQKGLDLIREMRKPILGRSFVLDGCTVTFQTKIDSLPEAEVGLHWRKNSDELKIESLPRILQGTRVVKQENINLWIESLEIDRSVDIYIAVLARIERDKDRPEPRVRQILKDSDLSSVRGGWRLLPDRPESSWPKSKWTWLLFHHRFDAGRVVMERPFPNLETSHIFFLRPTQK